MGNYRMMRTAFALLLFCLFCNVIFAQKSSFVSPFIEPEVPIYQKVNVQLDPHNLAASAIDFFNQRYPLPEGWAWNVVHSLESPGGFHFSVIPEFEGILLSDDFFKLNCDKKGRAMSILGKINDWNVEKVITWQVEPEQILSQAIEYKGGKLEALNKILFRTKNNIISAYDVQLTQTHDGGAWRLIYSSKDGSLLKAIPMFSNKKGEVECKGHIFTPDPLTSAKVYYQAKTPYADNNDEDAPFFQSQYQTVTLKGLKQMEGVYQLEGDFVKLEDIDSPNYQPVTSVDGNFFYNRSEHGFEEVNCYYHIDIWQRYIQSLGFKNLFNQPIRVDAHGTTRDNSAYMWLGQYLIFGTGGVDDGEDADVIIHEYNHAISAAGSPSSNYGRERQALDEGICDYFTASYSKNISDFRWEDLYTWDGHNEFWDGRTAEYEQNYTEAQKTSSTIHIFGQVWSTALMKVWSQIGKEPSDRIALQELYMNATNMTMSDAAHLILDADTLLYQGKYSPYYLAVFCKSGLLDTSFCIKASRTDQLEPADLSIYPNPNDGNFHLSVQEYGKDYQTLEYRILDVVGRPLLTGYWEQGSLIQVSETVPEGVYFLQIWRNGCQVWGSKWILAK